MFFNHDDEPDGIDVPSVTAAPEATVTFTGPAVSYTLRDPGDVVSVVGPRGPVEFDVDGSMIRRRNGHFGRGLWTVTYRHP